MCIRDRSNVVVESVFGTDIVTVLEMPDGWTGQEAADASGMDLKPSPGRVPGHNEDRCRLDHNGDRKLNVADVLGLLDASEDSTTCLLQIVREFNNLQLKP